MIDASAVMAVFRSRFYLSGWCLWPSWPMFGYPSRTEAAKIECSSQYNEARLGVCAEGFAHRGRTTEQFLNFSRPAS
jgi:hypothetical protein